MKESNVKHTRFNRWVWRNLPQCSEMVKTITASMDSKLTWREWIKLKIHLLSCDPCINFIKQLKFIRTVLRRSEGRLEMEDPKLKLSDDARARMKNALASSHAE
jgi:hypothetical protein